MSWLPSLGEAGDAERRQAGELAVTCAWIADKDDLRTLLLAERWRTEVLPALLAERLPGARWYGAVAWMRSWFTEHPADRWCDRHGRDLPRAARRALRVVHARDAHGARHLIDAWAELPAGASPAETAISGLRAVFRGARAVRRDLLALRAVQSMAVLDVRNYRDLVFRVGDYAADGEDPRLASALP
jgi:hypothetical protein